MLEKKETLQIFQPSSLSSQLKTLSLSEEGWLAYDGQEEGSNTTIPPRSLYLFEEESWFIWNIFPVLSFLTNFFFFNFYFILEYGRFTMLY